MASNSSFPGGRFGKYTVLAHIATGGMGKVFKALDEDLGRTVALKILPMDLAANPAVLERFRREARHAARLSHKNIVTLYEWGQVEGVYYLALEYVEGIDLAEYIHRRGQLPPEEARRMLIQAAKALDHAHHKGITHRDIKPSNFLLTQQAGRLLVKLTDMGLARTENEEEFRVTRAGSTVGTIDYLAPEQARDSSAADIRSDIYSLGCTFFHMLAGRPPFAEGGLGERVYKHLQTPPPDVREFNPQVSAELWAVLERMLAKDPAERYQTPAELLHDLKRVPAEAVPGQPAAPAVEEREPEPPRETRPSIPVPASEAGDEMRPPRPAQPPSPPPPSPPPDVRPPSTVFTHPVQRRDPGGESASRTPRHKRRHRREEPRPKESSSGLLQLSAEHMQAAAGQFERAREISLDAGSAEYAIQLLLSCCKLDPTNLAYREKLREVGRTAAERKLLRGWLSSLTTLATKTRLKTARRAGKHRQVLEYGEEVLVRNPQDTGTQLDMAEAAEALELNHVAVWLLEQVRLQDPKNLPATRSLARLLEKQDRFRQAISLWEMVRKIDPSDAEAARKINALAASDTIARGRYDG